MIPLISNILALILLGVIDSLGVILVLTLVERRRMNGQWTF